jgi:hypothetical protein
MRSSVDPKWNFANFRRFFDELEVADDEDGQVGHHGNGVLKMFHKQRVGSVNVIIRLTL